jgi:hypothetical protein
MADCFLSALPRQVERSIRSIRLFGPQARRFDPESPFDLLVVADAGDPGLRTAVAIGVSAVESGGLYEATATVASAAELERPTPHLSRLLRNAAREGVDLWVRDSSVSGG